MRKQFGNFLFFKRKKKLLGLGIILYTYVRNTNNLKFF